MYYKEEIINGVLCFKTSPNGTWTEYSQLALTKMLLKEIESNKMYKELLYFIKDAVNETPLQKLINQIN